MESSKNWLLHKCWLAGQVIMNPKYEPLIGEDIIHNITEGEACCAVCKYWRQRGFDGQCVKNPPTVTAHLENCFPLTNATTYCGAFTVEERRVKEVAEIKQAVTLRIQEAQKILKEQNTAEQTTQKPEETASSVLLDHQGHAPIVHVNQMRSFAARAAARK